VLVDRGGRRLPLAADYVGIDLVTPESEKVVVTLDEDDASRDSIRIEPANAGTSVSRT
jgi:pyrimidine operon attenuation protein/uracil phosphoribosyltransferase